MHTATKTIIDSAETASNWIVQKPAEVTGYLIRKKKIDDENNFIRQIKKNKTKNVE